MNPRNDADQKSASESEKSRRAMSKDMPGGTGKVAERSDSKNTSPKEPEPYLKDENVDNQKSRKSRKTPGHNDTVKKTPVPGAQLAKEKKAHKDNINKKADEADPKASG